MNKRIDPDTTIHSMQIRAVEKIFNKFCSGEETLAGALRMTQMEYDALVHGETSLSIEQIDRLCELGFKLDALFDADKKVL